MQNHHQQLLDGLLGLKPWLKYEIWADQTQLILIAEQTLPRQCPKVPAEETIRKLLAENHPFV